MAKELARYESEGGNEVVLTDVDVVRVISDNPNVTPREMKLFVSMCRAYRLDPFIREAYLIKYGTNPATMVVGKDVFTKRAFRHPRFRGFEAGVMVLSQGKGHEREGALVLDGEILVGGWARVHIEGYKVPIYAAAGFNEYAGRKKDGSLNKTWAAKPATMIRKVALVQALREAFPEEFGGLYDYSEMGVEEPSDGPVGGVEQAATEDYPVTVDPATGEVAERFEDTPEYREIYEVPGGEEPARRAVRSF